MTDLFTHSELIMQAGHAATHVPLPTPKPEIIQTGVTYMEAAVTGLVSFILGLVGGWFAHARGFAGLETDMSNIKNDIEKIYNKLEGKPDPNSGAVIAQPVQGTVVTKLD